MGLVGRGKARSRRVIAPSSITALKLIAKQGVDEKAQLEEWKEDFMTKLASEVAQLQRAHGEAIEVQRRA